MAPRRVLEPNMACVKNLILGMSCIFVLTGMLLIGVGSAIKGVYSNFDALLGSDYISPATFIIAVGAIVLFVSLFGCVGAVRESTCLLNIYTLCLILVFIFELSAGLAGFVMHAQVRSILTNNFKYAIQHSYLTDESVMIAIDTIQSELHCCGAQNPEDWDHVLTDNTTYPQLGESDIIVPDSCCGSWNITQWQDCGEPYRKGCLDTLVAIAQVDASMLSCVAIIIALIQAMGVYFSNELARSIRQAKSLRTMRRMEIQSQLANAYKAMNKAEPASPAPVVYLSGVAEDTPA